MKKRSWFHHIWTQTNLLSNGMFYNYPGKNCGVQPLHTWNLYNPRIGSCKLHQCDSSSRAWLQIFRGVWRFQLLPSDLLMTQVEVTKKKGHSEEPGRWIFFHKIKLIICVTSSFLTSNYYNSSVVVFECFHFHSFETVIQLEVRIVGFFLFDTCMVSRFDTPESLHGSRSPENGTTWWWATHRPL